MRKFFALIITTVLVAVVILIMMSLYPEYGGHNLQIATREYMKRNGGAWPKSWDEIEPYHRDITLFGNSVVPARWFWDIHWDFDPHSAEVSAARSGNLEGDSLPAIYRKAVFPADGSVEHWMLPRLLEADRRAAAKAAPTN